MEQHNNLSDDAFEAQFADGTLEPALFSHEAHIRLAWIHLRKYGETQAIQHITEQLKQYVRLLGAEDKYNATVTVAAVKIVHHFMQKTTINTFPAFIGAFPRLRDHFKELIGQHYGMDIFQSEEAKKHYLEPNLLTFT